MPRLNFIIAGAQRSATTALKAAMAEHPQIAFANNKPETLTYEGKYVGFPFATPYHSKSIVGLKDNGAAYDGISEVRGSPKHVGTKWPYFMVFPHIACNIRQQLPDARLIFILRNPMDCVWSSFRKSYKGDDLHADFDEFIDQSLAAIEDGFDASNRNRWPGMLFGGSNKALALDRGFYFPQINNFILLFGWDQLRILNYQDFAARPDQVVNRLFSWMKVDPLKSFKSTSKVHNAASEHTAAKVASAKMLPEQRARLTAFYEPSNRALCNALGWDYDTWITK